MAFEYAVDRQTAPFPLKFERKCYNTRALVGTRSTRNFAMSTAIGGWKSKPGGGMSPGPGGDRSTTYDIFVGNLPDQLDDVSLGQKRFLSGFSRSVTVPS